MSQCALTIIVTDEQLQDLYRIMIDGDEPGALAFLRGHLRCKVLLEVPGAGMHEVNGWRLHGT
jgi:hypothetical protein